jgi:hypothetical protein
MNTINITLFDECLKEIIFARHLYDTKYVEINFKTSSYKKIDSFLNIIKNGYMNKGISIDKISEIIKSLGYKVPPTGYPKFNSVPFKINMVMVSQSNMFQYKVRLNIDIDASTKYYPDNLDASSMYPTSRLYWSNARGGGKSLQLKCLNELSFSFNKEGGNDMIDILPTPKRVICSGPVTTVIYEDGSKTHVRKMEEDANDYEKAFLLSWLYKTYGKKVVNKKLEEFQEEFNVEESVKDDLMYTTVKEAAKNITELIRKTASKKHLG